MIILGFKDMLPVFRGGGFHGVSGIDYAVRPLGELHVIDIGVIGRNEYRIEAGDLFLIPLDGLLARVVGMLPGGWNGGYVRIVIRDVRAQLFEQMKQFKGRRFSHIIYVGFVGQAH